MLLCCSSLQIFVVISKQSIRFAVGRLHCHCIVRRLYRYSLIFCYYCIYQNHRRGIRIP